MLQNLSKKARWLIEGKGTVAATAQTMMTMIGILGINVLTGMITARTLGPAGRGEQAALILWPEFLANVVTLGIPSALVYNLRRYPEQRNKFFSAAVIICTILGVTSAIVGVMFLPRWLSQYPPGMIRTAQLFMPIVPIFLLAQLFAVSLEASSQFAISNVGKYMMPVGTLIMLVGFVASDNMTSYNAAMAYVLPGIVVFATRVGYLRNMFKFRWVGLKNAYRLLVGYGIRSYGVELVKTLSGQLSQVVIVGLLSSNNLGIYVVALSLSRMMSVFQTSFVTVLFPSVAGRPKEEVVASTGRAVRASLALTCCAGIVVGLLAPLVLDALYGERFLAAIAVFRILLVEIIVSGTVWVFLQAFMAVGKPGFVTLLQGLGVAFSVPLMFLLIPIYGLEGAGMALLCSSSIRLLLVYLSYGFVLKVKPPSLLLNREDLAFIFQSARRKQKKIS
ncbi:oligosaccharide flippase family protein [Waterburya agarophytonicola K14]|uniref:Oligosaccharide flippase family protein n=1 Tax=Waterburya agarophytonicola KI4 TaxID=2874699 RepID=A0A964BT25_9CYAN|nr:oligosaccharide flippase family protein [Waterburya agarophytonicola]MCC0177662.1 oligosaccharide flippase family protein [Waterburya agarophytonicola KI4]